jgi:hypothetical protein
MVPGMSSAFIWRTPFDWAYFDITLPPKFLRVASPRAFDGGSTDEEIPGLRLR